MVELVFVVALLGIVVSSLGMVSQSNGRAYRASALRAHLEAQAAATMEQLVVELSIAGRETLAPDPVEGLGADDFTYLLASEMDGDRVLWSPLRRLAFEYEIGELDDGLDNNGNGLVDEGRIVLTEDLGGADERRRVLTRWVREYLDGEEPNGLDDNGNGLVDERGFVVERRGETLQLHLTLQRLGTERQLLTRSARTSTRLRN